MKNKYIEDYINQKANYHKSFGILKEEALSDFCEKTNNQINKNFLKRISQFSLILVALLICLCFIYDDYGYTECSIYVYNKSSKDSKTIDNRLYLSEGETIHLDVKTDYKLTNLTWRVSDSNYITVNQNGDLHAIQKSPYTNLYLIIEGINEQGIESDKIILVEIR